MFYIEKEEKMQSLEFEGKAVGIIFDFSVRHARNGRRIIDIVKKRMIELVRNLLIDGEDSMYLYHPDTSESLISHGDQVCALGNYDTDGWKTNLNFAFRQTLYVLLAEDQTLPKYLIFITDRLQDSKAIEKAIQIDKKESINCCFILIGIGNNYNKNVLNNLKSDRVNYIHLDDPADLVPDLFKEKLDGKDSHC